MRGSDRTRLGKSSGGLHRLLEQHVAGQPDRIAVKGADGDLSWREFDRRATQIAHWLRERGIGPGARVAIFVERSTAMVTAIFGVLKSGAAYLPLDPANPEERLRLMLMDAKPAAVVTTQLLANRLGEGEWQVLYLENAAAEFASPEPALQSPKVAETDPAYLIYTSGSTGIPKGVLVSHGSVAHLLRATQPTFGFGPEDIWTMFHSCAFDLSVWELFGCLASGGTLIVPSDADVRSPIQFYDVLLRERVTVLNQTPSGMQLLLHAMEQTGRTAENLSLRLLVCGGEALPSVLAAKLLQWDVPLWNFYGPTEASVWATCGEVTRIAPDTSSIPIGRPIPGYSIHILDSDLRPVVDGGTGEIYIGGAGLALGYWNRPSLTEKRFLSLPLKGSSPPERVYKTGDLGRIRHGELEFCGRTDAQLKIRGFRIEPRDIEAALESHPAVDQAAIVAEGERLTAFIVAPSARVAVDEIRTFAQAKLPEYMVPARLVVVKELPLNTSGKVDRQALAAGSARPDSPRSGSADRLASQIQHLFEEAFRISPISPSDNFFELGGDSLMAACLCTEIEKLAGRELHPGFIYGAPTIEQLTELLRHNDVRASAPVRVVLQKSGNRPPLFCMNVGAANLSRFYRLARYLGPNQPSYGLLAPGSSGECVGALTIQSIAAAHLASIRTVQPHGPYHLAGISSGGVIAFEIAQQLWAQGEVVSMLAFLDATAGADAYHVVRNHLRVFLQLSVHERVSYLAKKASRVARKVSKTYRAVPLTAEAVRFQARMDQIHRSYMPKPYPGSAILFRAKESLLCFGDGGWGSIVRGGLEIREIPGDHTYLLDEPYIRTLAAGLSSCLHCDIPTSKAA